MKMVLMRLVAGGCHLNTEGPVAQVDALDKPGVGLSTLPQEVGPCHQHTAAADERLKQNTPSCGCRHMPSQLSLSLVRITAIIIFR